eukprot:3274262-Alexandrium_andersonii.AAC.1
MIQALPARTYSDTLIMSVPYTVLARIAHNTYIGLHGRPWGSTNSCRCAIAEAQLSIHAFH